MILKSDKDAMKNIWNIQNWERYKFKKQTHYHWKFQTQGFKLSTTDLKKKIIIILQFFFINKKCIDYTRTKNNY